MVGCMMIGGQSIACPEVDALEDNASKALWQAHSTNFFQFS
jgi:hypothetical protein